MNCSSLDKRALHYWQDKLAKFFPTSPGPTGTESDMYRAGYRAARADAKEAVLDLLFVLREIKGKPKGLDLIKLARRIQWMGENE